MKKIPRLTFSLLPFAALLLFTGFYFQSQCPTFSTVTPTKMYVFYIGVDNPIEITATGIPQTDIYPTISNGSIVKTPRAGCYNVRVANGTETEIRVMDGRDTANPRSIGTSRFRIKHLPEPVLFVGSHRSDDSLSPGEFDAAPGIRARPENFDFDVAFTILSYTLSVEQNGKWIDFTNTASAFTPEMRKAIDDLPSGSIVLLHYVKVQGPDGLVRKIRGASFTIK